MDRRHFIQGAGALLMGATLPALGFAASGAGKPTGRLVFGIPAGAVGSRLAEATLALLAQQYQLEYRLDVLDQRNTQQASETVKAAPADGTTLLQAQSASMVLLPHLYREVNYDPLTDFIPLALLGEYSFALMVGPTVPASITDINGYVQWVKNTPEFNEIGFAVYGSQVDLISRMLARGKQVSLRPLAYRSPRSLASDVENGTLAAAVMLAGSSAAVQSKKLRALAISSTTRAEEWPYVATFKEQGLTEISLTGWYAWYAPAGTPAPIVQALHDKLTAIQALPAYKQMQKNLLLTPLTLSPEQILARIRSESAAYRDLINRYGLSQMT